MLSALSVRAFIRRSTIRVRGLEFRARVRHGFERKTTPILLHHFFFLTRLLPVCD